MNTGDTVITKKQHPCGGSRWEVAGMGADVKIRCLTCGRTLLLLPDELKKRIKQILPKEG